ncbi:MAG: exodeoxyribonuclease VII small subunit, partial [Planctomyces sp.]
MARKKSVPEASAPAVDSESPELEHAMEELTLIVNQLEVGNGSLEESLRQYERGIQLLRACHGKLDAAA